jgi:SAM-dependent methyltransferase
MEQTAARARFETSAMIQRNACVACGEAIHEWFLHKDFPIFNGCTDAPSNRDELFDFRVGGCPACAMVQQTSTPDLATLYREPRAFGYGKLWKGHYDAFAAFVRDRIRPGDVVLEVGGGNGVLLDRLGTHEDVEPNPQYDLPHVVTHKVYFHDFEPVARRYDVIYASHLIEHVLDPQEFFTKAAACLSRRGVLLTACPDISRSLAATHLNAFTPDHFNYFTPVSLANLAAKAGLVATRYAAYEDHGMYMEFQLGSDTLALPPDQPSMEWPKYRSRLSAMGAVIDAAPEGAYLYGAHTFTLAMLRHVRDPDRFRVVLDNEPTKHNRRLTGTHLVCRSPTTIVGEDKPTVLIYMGAYSSEISDRLKELEPSVNAVRLT